MSVLFHDENGDAVMMDPDDAFSSYNSSLQGVFEINATTPLDISNNSLRAFLWKTAPDYIPMVAGHWLTQESPSQYIQKYAAIAFLSICVPSNIGHILIFVAYGR